MKKEVESKTSYVVANKDVIYSPTENIIDALKKIDWFESIDAAEDFIRKVHALGLNTDGVKLFELTTTSTLSELD